VIGEKAIAFTICETYRSELLIAIIDSIFLNAKL